MVDKSNEYGFVPSSPTQANQNNTGVFEVNDIVDLLAAGQWSGDFGKLELIETQTVSSVTSVDFTSIQESTYNVHFLTWNDVIITTGGIPADGIRLYEDGIGWETGNVYHYAFKYGGTTGTFGDAQTTIANKLFILNGGNGNAETYGYSYLYNLGDNTKYSFATYHNFQIIQGRVNSFAQFGTGVLPQASLVNRIQYVQNQSNAMSGTFSLYGIAES